MTAKAESPPSPTVLVWDRGVRVFHWALALSIAIAAVTGFLAPPEWLTVHLVGGVTAACLVVFRIVWGCTGSTYALFRSFPPSLSMARQHADDIRHKRTERQLGHNPFGALMVYGFLAIVVLVTATGVITLGGVTKQGPLAFATSFATGQTARQIHELVAITILLMVGAHIAGVAFESWRTGENLVLAMVTGRKRDAANQVPPVAARPLQAGIVLTALAVAGLAVTVRLSDLPGRGVPPATLDAEYARECGSCHFAFPPSLAGAATWAAVMGGLSDHFGENASLDDATTGRLALWLNTNAAEHWDTRAANMFRAVNAADPRRITATAGWKRQHRDLPDAVFRSAKVGIRGNCIACHADATSGSFAPQAIAIPKEARP